MIVTTTAYAAATAVDRWVADNIPADRDVVPLGFSQGGLVAVHLLRINRAVPGRLPVRLQRTRSGAGTAPPTLAGRYDIPVFYTYGKNDGVIPKYELFATAAWLEEHTAENQELPRSGSQCSLEEFADLRQWLLDNDITSGVL